MKINLNFNWRFVDDYDNSFLNDFPSNAEIVDIPHCIKRIPSTNFFENEYKKVVTYLKDFNLDDALTKNQCAFLDFDGYMSQADIYLNGNRLGHFVSLWNKVSIDVTKYLQKGNNQIIVVLDSRDDVRYPPFGGEMKYLNFAGIYKKVSLRIVPKIYIEKSFVRGNLEGRVSIKDDIRGEIAEKYTIKHEIFKDGKSIALSSISAFIIDFPELWSPKNPILYTLKTTVTSRFGQDFYTTRFGFRDLRIAPDGVFINNEVFKIIGINRLESYPYVGLAMPKSGQENDADLIKYKLGLNAVRCVGFPANEDFLNRCDEIGLLVISEPPQSVYVSGSDQWRNFHLDNIKQKVISEFNHPCIIANSIRIDGAREDRELFEESHTVAKEIDPNTPTFGAANRVFSEPVTDVLGLNDYTSNNAQMGLINPLFIKRVLKPIFISDYIGQSDTCKNTDDQTAKTSHALHHLKALNDVNRHEQIIGSFASSFSDYYVPYSLSSGDNIFYSGVLDIYRSKKPAAEAYFSQQEEKPMIKVLSSMKPYDLVNQTLGNITVLTNCDYVELFKDNKFVKRYYPGMQGYNDLKHPPIVIDDLLGKSLEDPRFNKKENLVLAKLFSKMALTGKNSLSISDYLTMFRLERKYHITSRGMTHLFNRYLGPSVIETAQFVFRAYKDDEWVASETFELPKTYDLNLDVQKTELIINETFDVSKIHIKYVDQTSHIIETANFGLHINIEGPLELISGKEIVTLKSGQCAIWVKTKKETGKAKLNISVEGINKEIEFNITKTN